MRKFFLLSFIVLTAAVFPLAAFAACSNNEDGVAGQEGEVEYFSDNILYYCDDTNWVPMLPPSGSGYSINAVNFPDPVYIERDGALTGVIDDNQFTASFWFKTASSGYVDLLRSDNNRFHIYIENSGELRTFVKDPSNGNNLNTSYGSNLKDGNWHHVMMSANGDTSTFDIYIDGTIASGTTFSFAGGNFDLTDSDWALGATPNSVGSGWSNIDGAFADIWVDFGTYIDLSVSSNRVKFYNFGPVSLGADGSTPTGSQPDIFLSGDTPTWHVNKGTAGGFTLKNGTITTANDAPAGVCDTTVTTYSTPGQYTYTVPANCAGITVEAYGAGGAGGPNIAQGGAGGGGGSVVETSTSTLVVVGGGGGGGGGEGGDGGGGGYGASNVVASVGEEFNIWVGGGGLVSSGSNGGAGGAVGGGAGGPDEGAGGDSTYGGGGGAGDDGGDSGTSVYGGGGGAGRRATGTAGESTYGGGGGGAESAARGTSTFGNNGTNGEGTGHGGGGGGYGDTVINGTNGGAAANGGPGSGGNNANGGNGQVIITPIEPIQSVSYWKLGETSGNTIADSGTSGNDGTWYDDTDNAITAESVTGQVGDALDFELSDNSHIIVAADPSIDNMSTMTACAWINPETLASGNVSSILSKTHPTSDLGWGIYIDGTSNEIGFQTRRMGYKTVNDVTLVTGSWQHVCVTWDGTDGFGGIAIYINGVEMTTTGIESGDWDASTFDDSAQSLRIGRFGTKYQYDGIIDEICLFTNELDAGQIAEIYSNGCEALEAADAPVVSVGTCSNAGEYFYNSTDDVMQWCDGTNLYNMAPAASGTGGCTEEGAIRYNTGDSAYESCDGYGWITIGK